MELTSNNKREEEEGRDKPVRQLNWWSELLDIRNPRFLKYAPSNSLFQSHLKAEKNALNNKEVCINDECIRDEHKNRIIGDQCQSKLKLEK